MKDFLFIPAEDIRSSEKKFQRNGKYKSIVKSPQVAARRVREICLKARLFEEVLYLLVMERLKVDVLLEPKDNVVLLPIQTDDMGLGNSHLVGFIRIQADLLRKLYKPNRVPKDVLQRAEDGAFEVKEEWFDKREKRLNLRFHESHNFWFAPPSAIVDLVLGYGMRAFASASLRNQLAEEDDCIPRPCVEVTLRYAPPYSEGLISEECFVRLDRLGRLVERRVAKEELKRMPAAACH